MYGGTVKPNNGKLPNPITGGIALAHANANGSALFAKRLICSLVVVVVIVKVKLMLPYSTASSHKPETTFVFSKRNWH